MTATPLEEEATLRSTATPGSSPSDRERTPARATELEHFGIDTIRVRGRVPEATFGLQTRQDITSLVGARGRNLAPMNTRSKVRVSPSTALTLSWRDGEPVADLEFSVPRLIRGDNLVPATATEVRRAVADMYQTAADHIEWACDLNELRLVRLDVARDFHGVADGHGLLEELSHLPTRAQTVVWRSRNCAGAQTVYRQTDRWVARLYDRAAMYEDRARGLHLADRAQNLVLAARARDTVRFELQLRRRLLAEAGIVTCSDLTVAGAEELARAYFERCRFGATVGGAEGRIRAAAAFARTRGDEAYREVGLAVGQIVYDGMGLTPPASEKTVRKRRMTALAYGLTPGNVFAPGPARRLDWASGTLVEARGTFGVREAVA